MPPRLLERLLGRLPRFFNKEAGAVLALRIRSPQGLSWRIADDLLTIRRPGLGDLEIPLPGLSILSLRDSLAAAGIELAYVNPDLLEEGALALIPGEGTQDIGDGDHLRLYSSLLWVWADTVGRALEQARLDVAAALRQMFVPTAEGEWLDLWGSFFGILRRSGEDDASMRERTLWQGGRRRCNPVAILGNVAEATGDQVEMREPWQEMMVASASELSETDHLPDAQEFSYHYAQLWSRDFVDWAPILREAEADRPAGTLYLPPFIHPYPFPIDGTDPHPVAFSGVSRYGWSVSCDDGQILDVNFRASNGYVLINPTIVVFELYAYYVPGLGNWGDLSQSRAICRGEIVLSDQWPLGDEQAHLPGAMMVEQGWPLRLSDSGRLSDYVHRLILCPINEWLSERFTAFCPAPDLPPQSLIWAGQTLFYSLAYDGAILTAAARSDTQILTLPRVTGGGWSDYWDERHWSDRGYPYPRVLYGTAQPVTRSDHLILTLPRILGDSWSDLWDERFWSNSGYPYPQILYGASALP